MPGKLRTAPQLDDPDAFYEALVGLHDGLDPGESRVVDAELVLVLANHIGDPEILDEAIELVRKTLR
jgi:hypothetical protein